jgi:hypothetical protein
MIAGVQTGGARLGKSVVSRSDLSATGCGHLRALLAHDGRALLRRPGAVAIVSNPWDVPNEVAGGPMVVCHRLRVAPEVLRDALRHYE